MAAVKKAKSKPTQVTVRDLLAHCQHLAHYVCDANKLADITVLKAKAKQILQMFDEVAC